MHGHTHNRIKTELIIILERLHIMLADLNAAITLIETAVAADTITENAAAALLTLLGASSTTGVTDPATLARLSAISATINTNNAMLSAAVKVNTPTPGTSTPTTFSPTVTYAQGALVVFTDGMTYSSNAAGNIGNTPSSTSTFWTVTSAPMIPVWVSTTTYNMNDKVLFNSTLYTSKIANNIGNQPDTVTTAWTAS
jgi:hypothetical protein